MRCLERIYGTPHPALPRYPAANSVGSFNFSTPLQKPYRLRATLGIYKDHMWRAAANSGTMCTVSLKSATMNPAVCGTAFQSGLDNGRYASGGICRMLGSSGDLITYEPHQDSGRTVRRGNTVNTDTVTGNDALNGAVQTNTVYGRALRRQRRRRRRARTAIR
jgi:hypothetical protein